MAYTYPVKWITSTMRGAPPISGTPGTFIAGLDAFLNTGWGSANAISVSISGGVGTAVFPEGVYFEDHAVVLFGGATTPAALNGEARVISHTNNSINFETDSPDGVATTGTTITCRYAPVGGWSKPFTGTNKAVFRSTDVQANGHYLRVDDSGATSARVLGYEAMTGIDAGTGPFPTEAMVSGGGYMHKSSAANTSPVRYAMAADSRAVLWAVESSTPGLTTSRSSDVRGFGDPVALATAGDAWTSFLSCIAVSHTFSISAGSLAGVNSSTSAGVLSVARAVSGFGGAILCDPKSFVGTASTLSGADAALGAAPSNVDGKIYLSKLYMRAATGTEGPRAIVPGVAYVPQSGVSSLVQPHAMMAGAGEWEGHKLLAIGLGANASSPPDGIVFLDVTGPWR